MIEKQESKGNDGHQSVDDGISCHFTDDFLNTSSIIQTCDQLPYFSSVKKGFGQPQ